MFKKTTLKNKIRLITVPMPHVKSVAVLVLVGVGSRFETEQTNGMAHFTEHMLFQGTKKYPTKMVLSTAVDKVGAEINGMTDKEYTGFYVKAEKKHLDLCLSVLSEMICYSLVAPEQIEREKPVIIEEINMREDIPQIKVAERLVEIVFEGNPLGFSGAGEKKAIVKFKRPMFRQFLDHHYTGKNTVIIVSGDIDGDNVKEKVEEYFGSLEAGQKKEPLFFQKKIKGRVEVIEKKTDQVHLCLGGLGFSRKSSQRYPQAVLDVILGAGMSSRLFQKIREEKSLAYYVQSGVEVFSDAGLFVVQAGVDKRRVEEAVVTILGELKKIADVKGGITDEELRKAKDFLRGKMVLRLEDTLETALFYGVQELLQDKTRTAEEILGLVEKVKVGDVVEVAQKIFKKGALGLVLIGEGVNKEKLDKII
jgi:predicted Zn-dependent peptidase